MATKQWPSWSPQRVAESKWLVYPCLLGVPNLGRKQIGCKTVAFSESPKGQAVKLATSPLPSRGPLCGKESKWLHHPCLLGVPKLGKDQSGCIALYLLGVTNMGGNQSGSIAVAFLDPQREEESKGAAPPLPSCGPLGGGLSKWLYHLCTSWGSRQLGGIKGTTFPVPADGSQGVEGAKWLHDRGLPENGVGSCNTKEMGGVIHATSTLPCLGPSDHRSYIIVASSTSRKGGEGNMATQRGHSLGPQSGEESRWLHHQAFSKIPRLGISKRRYHTLAFSGAETGRGPTWRHIA